jgi:protein-tyrosine phosphatase
MRVFRAFVFASNDRTIQGMKPYSVLFCCMGNICRSPTAEGVFRQKVAAAGLSHRISVDSAGTHDYHIGTAPDRRTQATAKVRGYDLSALRARQVERADFQRFDLILAMDLNNRDYLARLSAPAERYKLELMMDYARSYAVREVPDPYSGGPDGFELVLEMLEDATAGLLDSIRSSRLA